MKRIIFYAIVLFCVVSGCKGRGLGPDADPDQGGKALRTALEAWKDGKTPDYLKKQNPSIIMNEPAWHAGKRLVDYRMSEQSAMHGRQVRWQVQITVEDAEGETQERNARYIIDTTPRIVIVRDDQA